MTGLQKAVAIIALAVVALGWFNWRMWRQFRAAQAMRADWTEADFDAMLAADGVSPVVAAAARGVCGHLYGVGVAPHPDDDFRQFLGVEPEETEELVLDAYLLLNVPMPAPDDPEHVPPLRDLRDLARYLQAKVDAVDRSKYR